MEPLPSARHWAGDAISFKFREVEDEKQTITQMKGKW
jgi:hypothetical protein